MVPASDPAAFGIDLCRFLPGGPATNLGCAAVKKGVSEAGHAVQDAASGAMTDAINALVGKLAEAGAWLVSKVVDVVLDSTAPHLGAGWFSDVYDSMWYPATLAAALIFLVSVAAAGLRRDGAAMGYTVGGTVGAFLLAGVAPFIVQGLVDVVDLMCAHVAASFVDDTQGFLDRMGRTLAKTAALSPGLPVLVVGMLLLLFAAGSVLVWLELLLRTVGIDVLVVLAPLLAVTLISRGTSRVLVKTAWVVAALVFSKLVIVVVFVLGMAALAHAGGPDGSGANGLLAGGALVLLASLALPALLRLAPDLDAAGVLPSRGEVGSATGVRAGARASSRQVDRAIHKPKGGGQVPVKAGTSGAAGGGAGAGGGASAAGGAASAPAAAAVLAAKAGKAATNRGAASSAVTKAPQSGGGGDGPQRPPSSEPRPTVKPQEPRQPPTSK